MTQLPFTHTVNSCDWSYSHMPASVAKQHGLLHIMAYLSPQAQKNITSAELKAYHAFGLGVTLGYESREGNALLGAGQGQYDAGVTVAQYRQHVRLLGYAPQAPLLIPFAVDTDVSAWQFPTILSYLRAAQSVFEAEKVPLNATAYGEYDLIEYLAGHGVGKGLFQTLAWSGGRISNHTALYQMSINNTIGGYSVDYDQILNFENLGAWWPPGSQYDTSGEFAMDAQAKTEFDKVAASIATLTTQVNTLTAMVRKNVTGYDGQTHSQEGWAEQIVQQTGHPYRSTKTPRHATAKPVKRGLFGKGK